MSWRVCVVGGGPVGRLLAALLAGAGAGQEGGASAAGRTRAAAGDVRLVARRRDAARPAAGGGPREPLADRRPGQRLRLLVPGEAPLEVSVRPAASVAEGVGAAERVLAVVAVKGWDTEAVAAELAPLAAGRPTFLVLTVQNGLGHEETLARAVGAERVLAGALTAAVSLEGDGSVRVHSRRAGLALAALAPSPAAEEAMGELAGRLARPWLRTAVRGDWAAVKWSKLLLNILGNATAALLDEPPAAALARPGVFALERAAFLETLAVMRRLGLRPLSLPGYPVPLLARALALPVPLARLLVARRLAGGRGGKEPSFLLDLRRGRPTEAPFLLGAVAEAGRRLGVPTPVCAALADALERAAGDAGFRASLRGDAGALLGWLEARHPA